MLRNYFKGGFPVFLQMWFVQIAYLILTNMIICHDFSKKIIVHDLKWYTSFDFHFQIPFYSYLFLTQILDGLYHNIHKSMKPQIVAKAEIILTF